MKPDLVFQYGGSSDDLGKNPVRLEKVIRWQGQDYVLHPVTDVQTVFSCPVKFVRLECSSWGMPQDYYFTHQLATTNIQVITGRYEIR